MNNLVRNGLILSLGFVSACLTSGTVRCEELRITPDTDLKAVLKGVTAGDSLILQNGTWVDADLTFELLPGTADAKIRIQAETPGQVVFTGKTQFRFSGTHVVVSGFVFRNPQGVSDVVQLRTHSERHAHHCRLTDCVIEESAESDGGVESRWLSVYGSHNRIDHCYVAGKKNRGTTVVVWVEDGLGDHRIDRNHFGSRPELGENGGETLRIGTSEVSELSSRTIVEENYFHRCDGEAEIVSNKSCENIYRHNLFDECSGTLTLRHGHRCLVDGNAFLGRQQNGTGGVRIIGDAHTVVNNYFEGLRGNEERAALCMMNGIPDSPLHKYSPFRRAVVSHNCFVECKVALEIGVGAGKKQPAAPAECRVTHNVFLPGKWEIARVHTAPVQFEWLANLSQSEKSRKNPLDAYTNFESAELNFERGSDGLLRPTATSPIRVDVTSAIKTDIDNAQRAGKAACGCDEPGPQIRDWPSGKNTGPTWR